ncbi:hypothetical protein [Hippea sp. KM1]|uniref:hypothetical protein n=1 Tax=Hippea sp. KM1 TaxID=944481 RepID=UPI00046D8AA6|nr:hypothetical protein [Hippea sp. KM1]
MDEKRKDIYDKLFENSKEIEKEISKKDFNLAEVDRLFRKRNELFDRLKSNGEPPEDELELAKKLIDDNNRLIDMVIEKKEQLLGEFKSKESDAKKISQYLKK